MKNLMGVVLNRSAMHINLVQCIADLATYVRPQLTVIDAAANRRSSSAGMAAATGTTTAVHNCSWTAHKGRCDSTNSAPNM